MKILIENQSKLVILVLFVLTFGLFGFISPQIHAQVERSSTICTRVGAAADADNPCRRTNANFVFYCQDDPQWYALCPSPPALPGTPNAMPASGCGPTSAAMIVSSLGLPTNPTQMNNIFGTIGAKTCGDTFTYPGAFAGSNWLEANGFDVQGVSVAGGILNLTQAADFIGRGYYIFTSSHVYPCQGDSGCRNPNGVIDHVFVIDQVDIAHNSYEVRDPANCVPGQGYIENAANMTRANNFPLLGAWAITSRQR